MSVTLPLPVSTPFPPGRSTPVRSGVGLTSPATVRNRHGWRGLLTPRPVAVGIFVSVVIWAAGSLVWPTHSPARSLFVMPFGLPDLHATLDAMVFCAQAMADQGAPPLVAPPAAPAGGGLPQFPGLDTIVINLGGWAAILYGLASKIGRQVDNRVAAIETQLAHLSEMPRQVRLLRRELRRYRMTPGSHPLPGKPPEETP